MEAHTSRDWPLKYNGKGAWAVKSDQGPVLTNADVTKERGSFGVGDRVIQVDWINRNGWVGWTSVEYMKIPEGNGLAKSGLYTFGQVNLEVTEGIVTNIWKTTNQENGKAE